MSVKKKQENSFLNSELNKLSKPYRVQSAAVLSAKDTTVEQMYQLANRMETNWGVEGYEAPKKYADPMKQMKEREYNSNQFLKGQKNKNYVTKRGNYLDDLKKVTDTVPGPNKYETTTKWQDPKEKPQKPQSAPPKRMTFIDQIYKEQKLRATPGTGKYNLEKTYEEKMAAIAEQKKRKIQYPERPNFLCEYEYMADYNPGPGNYNPREIQQKLKVNNTKPKEIIEKHKEQESKRVKSAFPDVADFLSFGKQLLQKEEKKQDTQQAKKNYWGTDTRFKDLKKTKSKLNIATPGPGAYPLVAQWPSKEDGLKADKNGKTKNWMEGVTKGTQRSIYY